MPNLCDLDLETYSETPISYGAYRYAESAEILLMAYALDDGPVQVWDKVLIEDARAYGGDGMFPVDMPTDLYAALTDEKVIICAHNANFDRVVLKRILPALCPAIPRWRDTLARALAHGLPGSLDALGDVLHLAQDQRKLKTGRQLVQLFSKPRPKTAKLRRATQDTHPAEWQRFVEYARQDIEALRAIDKKLPVWKLPGRRTGTLAAGSAHQRPRYTS